MKRVLISVFLTGTMLISMLLVSCGSPKTEIPVQATQSQTTPAAENSAKPSEVPQVPFSDENVETPKPTAVDNVEQTTGSEGLEYEVNRDKETCSITGIGECTDKNIIIPSRIDGYLVTAIEEFAFCDCVDITGIQFPDSLTSIEKGAFKNTGLTNIVIPDSVTSIGNDVFCGCEALTDAVIGEGITSISGGAFFGCGELTSIAVPDSVTQIDGSAFDGCSKLTQITIPDSVTSISSAVFRDCASLTSVTIPDGVKKIQDETFKGCSALTSVTIGNGVEKIGENAFTSCKSLQNITLPESVAKIGAYAFALTGLTEITFNGTKEQWNSVDKYMWDYESGDHVIRTIHCIDGDISQ